MSETTQVAILASGDRESGGGGSTMERFIIDTQTDVLNARVGLVVCNNPRDKVPGLYARVEALNQQYGLNIDVVTINGVTHPGGKQERGQTLQESEAIYQAVLKHGLGFVMCLGYMKKLNGVLVEEMGWKPEYAVNDPKNKGIYRSRIANTHPGILPDTANTHGAGASQRSIDLGLTHNAHTLHVVASGIDDGPTIAQNLVLILPGDTADSLFDRVHDIELARVGSDMNSFFKDQQEFLKQAS